MTKHPLYLVAVDGSEWGNRAVAHAVQMAQQTGARIKLITVIPWSGYQPLSVEEMAYRPLAKEDEEKRAQTEILDPLLEKYQDSGVALSTAIEWGHPVDVIQHTAKAEKAKQVYLGRRGRSRVADLILGSVANSLTHSLGVPIVLVP